MTTALEVSDLVKRFGSIDVLKGISFSVEAGSFVCLLGPSGCGKSTLLRCIAGLEAINSGAIKIDGKSMVGVEPSQRNLAMVFQSYALYPHLNARRNMSFGLKIQGVPKAEIDSRVNEAARMLDITELLDRRPRQLSGGQRQRVAIGRAIVRNPSIFLFDEPLSNLDAALRTQTRQELARLHRELGRTMLFVTHDQVEAMTLATSVVVLNAGKVEQVGHPLELYRKPKNRFVATFIGSPKMNLLPTTAQAGRGKSVLLSVGTQYINIPVSFSDTWEKVSELGVRPEDLSIGLAKTGTIKATVRELERLGAETIVFTITADGIPLIAKAQGIAEFRINDLVHLTVDIAQIHCFDSNDQRVETGTDVKIEKTATNKISKPNKRRIK